jgi:acyl transferase domain-containing protein
MVDGIAVVGISCTLPQASNPAEFWALLSSGRDAITEVPADRWQADTLFDSDQTVRGRMNTRWGGFLDQVDQFDASFFGISPREAAAMDPQHRLAMELSWEALEDAAIVPGTLAGSRTGVFIASIWDDYATLVHRMGLEAITRHTAVGLQRGLVANRVSYALRLRGPSMAVDTAQSSALVAVHLACESLRRGESTVAIAGGVNLNLVPDSTMTAAKFGGMSPDGRSYTFDARANGYVKGEGGGIVVLKPLAAAVADGDPIYCVLRGSAMNNDGGGAGFTAPNPLAQQEVLASAYAAAGLDPGAAQYVELHGTGTRVGDPIEAAALGAVIGRARRPGDALLVGSAKTNVGHLEGAAGVVGLLKTVLCLRHRELVPSLNFEIPNPAIDLSGLNLDVCQERRPWPDPATELVAGVSSFGMGGTNCHVVLSSWDSDAAVPVPGRTLDQVPWVISGRTDGALRAQARRLRDLVEGAPELTPADIGWSLATTRTEFERRAVLLGTDRAELTAGLAALADGLPTTGVVQGTALAGSDVVFVFPGQGPQWAGMAVELLESSPFFAARFGECGQALSEFVEWQLLDVVRGAPDAPSLDRVDVVQPVLFAVMVSLAALWRSYGVEPRAVIGHSQGEIAAACVAGALSLRDAARVVALRSRVIRTSLTGSGCCRPLPVRDSRSDRTVGRPDLCGCERASPPWSPATRPRWTNSGPSWQTPRSTLAGSGSTTPRTPRRSRRSRMSCST